MFEFLLYAGISCSDVNAMILRIQNHDDFNKKVKLELVETVKESVPECDWGAND